MSSPLPPAFELPDEAPFSDSESSQRSVPGGSGSGLLHGAKTRKPAFRKRQFRFDSDSELAFIRELSVRFPWEGQYGDFGSAWDAVAENLCIAGHNVDEKHAKEKYFALIKTIVLYRPQRSASPMLVFHKMRDKLCLRISRNAWTNGRPKSAWSSMQLRKFRF
jgi:hypothetical protein